MSGFIGNSTSAIYTLQLGWAVVDNRLMPRWYVEVDPFFVVRVAASWDIAMGYETPWWPGAGRLDTPDDAMLQDIFWSTPDLYEPKGGGTNSRYGVYGVTRDVYGTPVGGVVCKLFRTTGDLYKDVLIDETISDPSGNYFLSTPFYPDAHYVVTYKTGSPDTFGSSPNTLIGA
jgi:hypothetical protein